MRFSLHTVLLPSAVVVASVCVLVGCRDGNDRQSAEKKSIIRQETSAFKMSPIQKLVSSEELILELTNRLGPLNRSAENLKITVRGDDTLFADNVSVIDIGESTTENYINDYVSIDEWSLETRAMIDPDAIWAQFFENVNYLESARFYFVDGQINPETRVFDSTMGFASHLVTQHGAAGFAKSKIKVRWQLAETENALARIIDWETKSFEVLRTADLLFADVTAATISDSNLAKQLAKSVHADLTERLIKGDPVLSRKDQNYKLFFPEVTLEHPAVSVVDIDDDGWDDFFLARPHEPSLMFHNRGDGTFDEVGEPIGLRFDHDCTCSLFADFDNDGDQDVFIGRARHRAIYLKNENGKFTISPESIDGLELPYMVSSISAADYDNNGLLDVYFSTYSPIEGSHADILSSGNIWPKHFLSTIEQVEFSERRSRAHPYIDMVGPPNLLLNNHGDGFELSKQQYDVESWRKSFQSSWCDFDQDGDQDLYVCNDFSPDDLFRNESGKGFTRVTEQVGLDQLGFGMGVSWNDHNNDGRFDLYVSNMFSKAGTRIVGQIEGLDPRIGQMAQGNYLYAFDGSRFNLESLDGPQQAVSRTGWSWGGQLTDLDDDGFMDIVVANGYYSAPKDVATEIDL